MNDETLLLLANRAWAAQLKDERPDFFERQAAEQKPNFLWIGCSDSRVAPDQITNSPPGVMSIHRNVANLVYEEDENLMAVLQVALEKTKVRHIILCGHLGCGGVEHGLKQDAEGALGHWVRCVGDLADRHADELRSLPDAERLDRLVELNVREQLERLSRTAAVQAAFRRGQPLTLHGWIYDLRDGTLNPLAEISGAPEPTVLSAEAVPA
ncbi:carbonic anhydrase [Sphingomonas jejuensis]|uniref:carbonic anhydrase n=1 Tax=Sphingomonas jejuensis TaxID=904715 RepID=A0ABX0XI93_9SPHN|nr:carbonic anhydrase [Sphingomonas jejuensis]NJC32950.1 carbonic anhydrase [Sphingomonas jejuensis]